MTVHRSQSSKHWSHCKVQHCVSVCTVRHSLLRLPLQANPSISLWTALELSVTYYDRPLCVNWQRVGANWYQWVVWSTSDREGTRPGLTVRIHPKIFYYFKEQHIPEVVNVGAFIPAHLLSLFSTAGGLYLPLLHQHMVIVVHGLTWHKLVSFSEVIYSATFPTRKFFYSCRIS